MYELIQVSDRCYYIQSPAKIGLVKTGPDTVCLIDSGSDKDAGKKVRKHLDAKGWRLAVIYNTHSHADHIGGNQYLQKQTGCEIYAPGIDRDFTEHPLLEPSYLFGGNPPRDLRHKFLMAQASQVRPLTKDVLPAGLELIPLPGLSSPQTLEKYQINFLVDVQAYLDTLEAVQKMDAALFIPSHAEPAEDIAPLAQLNIDKVHEIGDRIVELCREPACFEVILKKLFDSYRLAISFEQYALAGSTVRSYLTWLRETGRLTAGFENNLLLWRA